MREQFTPQYGDSFIEWLRLCLLVAAGFGTHSDDAQDDELVTMAVDAEDRAGNALLFADSRTLRDVRQMDLQKLLPKVNTKRVERRYDAPAVLLRL